MKKLIAWMILLVMVGAFAATAGAEGYVYVLIEDGFTTDNIKNSVIVTEAGNLVIAGSKLPEGTLETGIPTLREVTTDGKTVWEAGDAPETEYAYYRTVVVMDSGAYVVNEHGGRTSSKGEYELLNTLTRIRDGKIEDTHTIVENQTFIYQGKNTVLVMGTAEKKRDSHGGTFYARYLAGMDESFNELWREEYHDHELRFSGLIPVETGYVAYGHLEEQETGDRSQFGMVALLDDAGKIQWINSVESNFIKQFNDAEILADGSILAIGEYTMREAANEDSPGYYGGIAARFSATGELLWETMYDSTSYGKFFAMEPVEGGYLCIGNDMFEPKKLKFTLLDDSGKELGLWHVQHAEIGRFIEPVDMLTVGGTLVFVGGVRMSSDMDAQEYRPLRTYISIFDLEDLAEYVHVPVSHG